MTMHIGKFEGNDYHIIYKHSELIELLEWQSELCSIAIANMIRNVIPVDRWDHENFDIMAAIVQMSFIKMRLGTEIPLLAFKAGCREFAVNMFEAWDKLEDDEVLLINHNGGYRPGKRDLICDGKEFTVKPLEHLTIVEGSKLLVIENDPVIDKWTVENLHASYSYIVNLGRLSKPQTVDLMKQFRNSTGGTTLFVYTTGINDNQMIEYTNAAIEARFKRIIWVPSISNCGGTFNVVRLICDDSGVENDVIPKDQFISSYLEEALCEES
jgi:hypothetical protein